MKFVTFRRNGAPEPGVLWTDQVVSLKAAGFSSMLDVIAGGVAARARIEEWILKPPSGRGRAARLGSVARPDSAPAEIHLHRPELHGSRDREQARDPQGPDGLLKVRERRDRTRRDHPAAAQFDQARLRGRVRRHHRQGRPLHSRRQPGASTSSATPISTTSARATFRWRRPNGSWARPSTPSRRWARPS